MGKVLIIEGPRCAGKTTLANELVKGGWQLLKVQRGTDVVQDQNRMLHESMAGDKNIVIDRFHLTEYIGSLFWQRVSSGQAETNVMTIDRLLKRYAFYGYISLIILNPPVWVVEKRLKERTGDRKADMPPGIAHILWRHMAYRFEWPVTHFDDMDLLVDDVRRFVHHGYFIER